MGLITGITYPNNGDRIKVSDYNPTIQTIIAMLNGNLGSENITAGSLPWEAMASFTNKIPATAMQDSGNLEKFIDEDSYDYVSSGCVWSGDAYGSTRNASMTAGVVRINGKRIAITAVTARAFTASKDTYVDVGVDGVVDYNEVANNAASPALATDHMRVAIIVTGASNIANVGSVNQGQEDKVLPIASSVPYAVTDSLGNLICPRDPRRRILGYRRILTDFSTTSTDTNGVQITGLSCPVIVPDGRKVKITVESGLAFNTSINQFVRTVIWKGTVGSGTFLKLGQNKMAANTIDAAISVSILHTPSTSSNTFNAALTTVGGGTATFGGNAQWPASIMVELT